MLSKLRRRGSQTLACRSRDLVHGWILTSTVLGRHTHRIWVDHENVSTISSKRCTKDAATAAETRMTGRPSGSSFETLLRHTDPFSLAWHFNLRPTFDLPAKLVSRLQGVKWHVGRIFSPLQTVSCPHTTLVFLFFCRFLTRQARGNVHIRHERTERYRTGLQSKSLILTAQAGAKYIAERQAGRLWTKVVHIERQRESLLLGYK